MGTNLGIASGYSTKERKQAVDQDSVTGCGTIFLVFYVCILFIKEKILNKKPQFRNFYQYICM